MNSKIIKKAVENAFNTFIDVKSRKREIVYIRSIYYKLCKDFTKESLDAIGKHVNKDHATVLNGLKIFDNIIDNFWEKELFNVYLDIRKTIQNKITLEVKSYDPDKFYRDKYRIAFKLEEKALIMMDNYMLLHGSTAYQTSEGNRLLQGCYSDYDSTDGKLIHLKRKYNL